MKVNLWFKIKDALAKYGLLDRSENLWKKRLSEDEYKKATRMLGEEVAKRERKDYSDLCVPMKYTRFGWEWLDWARYGVRHVYHPGVDYNWGATGSSDCGLAIKAMADGVVTYKAYTTGWGWHMFIIHNIKHKIHGDIKCWTHYAHLRENPPVAVGNKVECGQTVARCGKTGTQSCHSHFEIRKRPLGVTYFPYGKSKEWVIQNYYDPINFIENK